MKLTTTLVDDMDLGVAPTNYRADQVKRTAVGKGTLGDVQFLWPIGDRLRNLTLYYDRISWDHARRLVTALGRSSVFNRVLMLDPAGPTWFIPGKVTINASFEDGYATVRVETIARRFGPVSTETFATRPTGVSAPTPVPAPLVPDFYWYSFRGADNQVGLADHMTERREGDGTLVWDTWDDPYLAEPFHDLYSWPGYPDISSTRQGAFHPVDSPYPNEAAFFLITPDGQPGGKALAVPQVTLGRRWGVAAIEDNAGDHYVIYYNRYRTEGTSNNGPDSIVVAGWNGMTNTKWTWTAAQLVTAGILPTGTQFYWSTPTSLALSADGTVLATLWLNNHMAGFRTSDGALLWTMNPYPMLTSGLVAWEGWQGMELGSDGSLYIHTFKGPDRFAYNGLVARFAWPNPAQAPTLAWDHLLLPEDDGENGLTTGIAPDADGGVILLGADDRDWPPASILRRYSSTGQVLWSHTFPVGHETVWARILRVGDAVLVPQRVGSPAPNWHNHLRRYSVETGLLAEEGTSFPFLYDTNSMGLALVI